MATMIEELSRTAQLSNEAATVAEQSRASVVAIRGSRVGVGSGVVWNTEGLVITNHHVVSGERAEILLPDGVERYAQVTMRDQGLDLAALQIEGPAPAGVLTPATVGDSSRLRIGELVVAIGNPLGERNALALGVISGKNAPPWLDIRAEVIQMAIELQPGNSGGALVDAGGNVVGIPNMVIGAGLGLAVPSNVVQRFLLGSEEARSFFGLVGRWIELPSALAARHGLRTRFGMMLTEVPPDSPAERADLTVGDTIVGLAGSQDGYSDEPAELVARLGRAPLGQPVTLNVVRAGELARFELTPVEKP